MLLRRLTADQKKVSLYSCLREEPHIKTSLQHDLRYIIRFPGRFNFGRRTDQPWKQFYSRAWVQPLLMLHRDSSGRFFQWRPQSQCFRRIPRNFRSPEAGLSEINRTNNTTSFRLLKPSLRNQLDLASLLPFWGEVGKVHCIKYSIWTKSYKHPDSCLLSMILWLGKFNEELLSSLPICSSKTNAKEASSRKKHPHGRSRVGLYDPLGQGAIIAVNRNLPGIFSQMRASTPPARNGRFFLTLDDSGSRSKLSYSPVVEIEQQPPSHRQRAVSAGHVSYSPFGAGALSRSYSRELDQWKFGVCILYTQNSANATA